MNRLRPLKNTPFCSISAKGFTACLRLGSNFGTLVKLQRYPRNTRCIYHARHWLRRRLRFTTHRNKSIRREVPPTGEIFARLELKQNWAFFKGLSLFSMMMVICLIAACSSLPELQTGPDSLKGTTPAACRAVFPEGKWQFVHSIEASFPGGGENLLMGVTVVDASTRAIDCVLMTVEGFVLFRAHLGKTLDVARAVSPFDREGFADGMLADIRLMFLVPAEKVSAIGRFADDDSFKGQPACRYTENKGITTDVIPGSDSRWQLRRYSPQGRLTRTVVAEDRSGPEGFPGRLRLTAHGVAGYTLVMKLVDAVRFDD